MNSDYKPILFNAPKEAQQIEIHPLHDIHRGNVMHNSKAWERLKRYILDAPNRYVIWIGDMMENATRNSKSDVFYQTEPPHEQKYWLRDQLIELKDRTAGILPGNHEIRSSKDAGMFPVYDAAVMAGLEDKYRSSFMFVDIGVGTRTDTKKDTKQVHYVGYCVHKATNQVKFGSADALDGIDFFLSGHDHQPMDRPRGRLCYDPHNKKITQRSVETINCGAGMDYGGYAAEGAYRPGSLKRYCLILDGTSKGIRTEGFYV